MTLQIIVSWEREWDFCRGKCTNRCKVKIGILERSRIIVNKIYIYISYGF